MFFKCAACEVAGRERLLLLSQIQDLRDQLAAQAEAALQERAAIMDRMMAALSPAAFRTLRGQEHQPSSPPKSTFPGVRPSLRPPDPPPTGD